MIEGKKKKQKSTKSQTENRKQRINILEEKNEVTTAAKIIFIVLFISLLIGGFFLWYYFRKACWEQYGVVCQLVKDGSCIPDTRDEDVSPVEVGEATIKAFKEMDKNLKAGSEVESLTKGAVFRMSASSDSEQGFLLQVADALIRDNGESTVLLTSKKFVEGKGEKYVMTGLKFKNKVKDLKWINNSSVSKANQVFTHANNTIRGPPSDYCDIAQFDASSGTGKWFDFDFSSVFP